MPLAAFAVAVAYWPGFYYPGEAARWIALSVLLWPALALTGRAPRTWLWWLGAAFLGYAALSLTWTISPASTWHALWKLTLFAGAVAGGASLSERGLKWTLLAFAAGIALNGALALAQLYGWNPSLGGNPIVQVAPPAGLFVNRNGLAEAGLLALVIAYVYRAWWLLPLCLAAAFLPLTRGVFLAVAITVAMWALQRGWRRFAGVLTLSGFAGAVTAAWYEMLDPSLQSTTGRLALWHDTLSGLRWNGYGAGTFDAAYPMFVDRSGSMFFGLDTMPGTPHNDILLLLSEYGAGAFLLFAFVVLALWRGRHDRHVLVVAAFIVMGLVAFPFQMAAQAFVACVCLGVVVRTGCDLRDSGLGRRDPVHGRDEHARAIGATAGHPSGGRAVSVRGAYPAGGGSDAVDIGSYAAAARADGTEAGAGGQPRVTEAEFLVRHHARP